MIDGSLEPDDFGGINTGITNGLKITVHDSNDTELLDFTADQTIKINQHWALLAGTDVAFNTQGAGDDAIAIRWTFTKSNNHLLLTAGQYFQIKVQDNITDMTSMIAFVQGHNLSNPFNITAD